MSFCYFLASDKPLQSIDNNLMEQPPLYCPYNAEQYSQKRFYAELVWDFSDELAQQLIDNIKHHLESAIDIEMWKVWLGTDFDTPVIKRCHVDSLEIADIKDLNERKVAGFPVNKELFDEGYTEKGHPFCLVIHT